MFKPPGFRFWVNPENTATGTRQGAGACQDSEQRGLGNSRENFTASVFAGKYGSLGQSTPLNSSDQNENDLPDDHKTR